MSLQVGSSKLTRVLTLTVLVNILGLSTSFGAGPVLPISAVTPGAINPEVTQKDIDSTICVPGYTTTIRPSSAYTTGLKEEQLQTSYSEYKDLSARDFEEDHLISLELGGSPTDPKNLWPEPYAGITGARVKDKIENKLHSLVCEGVISLATAQKAIETNWYAAYTKYIGVPTVLKKRSPSSSKKPKAPINPNGSWPDGATGKCVDGTYSHSQNHRGMCSHHGGVEVFKA